MSNNLKSKLLGAAIILFGFALPIFITFTTYVTIDTATPEQITKITVNMLGILIVTALIFALIKWLKKRVRNKIDSGLKVSPYYVLFLNNTFGLILLVLFGWFIHVVKDEIAIFSKLLWVIVLCEIIAYGLKYWQTHFDILVSKET